MSIAHMPNNITCVSSPLNEEFASVNMKIMVGGTAATSCGLLCMACCY